MLDLIGRIEVRGTVNSASVNLGNESSRLTMLNFALVSRLIVKVSFRSSDTRLISTLSSFDRTRMIVDDK